MRIGGFQKLTLLDYPGHTACIVFTRGCNFRCPFCHNSGLVLPGQTQPEEKEENILAYLARRRKLLDGVVVTGGEPLLWPDLPEFLKKVRSLGYLIKLDTNGSFPDRLQSLLAAGFADYVAMDVKQTPKKYALAIGQRESVRPASLIEESLSILRAFRVPFELRTTVIRGIHTPEDLLDIAAWIRGPQPWYLQSYVDSGSVLSPDGLSAFSREELLEILERVRPLCPGARLRE